MGDETMEIPYDIDKLPPMPQVAARTVKLLNSPDVSAEDLAEVVSADPIISVRVLKIANSSFYSMARQVKTLQTAIIVLGQKTLKNLVLAASLRGMNTRFGPIEQMLWEDSMTCALAARFLSRKLRIADPEEAFIAGLFRHIGRVVLNNQDSTCYQGLLAQQMRCGAELMSLEKEKFGLNHAELGAAVLNHWQLSEVMSLVALRHHDPVLAEIDDLETRELTAITNLASEFSLLLGVLGAFEGELDLAALPGARYLKLDAERIAELVDEFREVFEENREAFLG